MAHLHHYGAPRNDVWSNKNHKYIVHKHAQQDEGDRLNRFLCLAYPVKIIMLIILQFQKNPYLLEHNIAIVNILYLCTPSSIMDFEPLAQNPWINNSSCLVPCELRDSSTGRTMVKRFKVGGYCHAHLFKLAGRFSKFSLPPAYATKATKKCPAVGFVL